MRRFSRLKVIALAAGLFAVPVLAYAGPLVASWRSGSVIVRTFGPLPTVTWRPSEADFVPGNGGGLGAYRFSQSFSVPALRLSGLAGAQGLVTFRVTMPDSATLGFDDVLEEEGGFCLVRGILILGDSDGGPEIFSYTITLDDEFDEGWPASFPGETFTSTQQLGATPNEFSRLSSVTVLAEARCNSYYSDGGFTNHPIDFSDSPEIVIEVKSLRVLAY